MYSLADIMIKKKLLEDSGLLPLWELNQETLATKIPQSPADTAKIIYHESTSPVETPQWEKLEAEIKQCRKCRLCEQRTNTVFGVGDRNPDILFVGEGPGAEEDKRGEPFVGQAGKLLDAIFASLGMTRQKGVFIANAVKCRPPENRKPFEDEMLTCFPYLEQQIKWLSPKIIIALGATGAQTLLKTDTKIGMLRGKIHHYDHIPLIATYHPAYLLRSPMEKAKVWSDMVFALRILKKQSSC
jgi:DNA polymerase